MAMMTTVLSRRSCDERDLGHRWLRTVIGEEFAVLYAPSQLEQRRGRHSPDKLDVQSPLRHRGAA
jgi:hypothetical protein